MKLYGGPAAYRHKWTAAEMREKAANQGKPDRVFIRRSYDGLLLSGVAYIVFLFALLLYLVAR